MQPLTPHATIPRQSDIDAAIEIVKATEPEILPPLVAEAVCDASRLDALHTLVEETDDE